MQQLRHSNNRDALLPDWQKAEAHAKAVKVGRALHMRGQDQTCECCNRVINRQEVNLSSNIKSLSFLGFGIPLFYLFLQYCIILNLMLVVTDGILMLYSSHTSNQAKCNSHFVSTNTPTHHLLDIAPMLHEELQSSTLHFRQFSHFQQKQSAQDTHHKMKILCQNPLVKIANVEEKSSMTEIISRVCSFIIHVFFLIYIKNSLYKTGEYYNEMSVDLADYSILLRRLPKTLHNKKNILETALYGIRTDDNRPIGYYQIIVLPENEVLEERLAKKEQISASYLKNYTAGHNEEAMVKYQQYLENDQMIKQESERTLREVTEDTIESENVIITFNLEEDRSIFMQDHNLTVFRQRLCNYMSKEEAEEVEIEQAPGPKEIIWHHLKHSSGKQLKVMTGWLLSIAFLFLILVVFYFISQWKAKLLGARTEGHSNIVGATAVAWITFIGIILFNKFVMGTVLHHFTHIQHHDNKADQEFSFAFKYAVGMFFTTCFMTLLVQAFLHHNYYKHRFGVIEEESMMFIFSAVLVPLIWLIHPYQLYHQFQRWRHQGKTDVTQRQANDLMADYEYSLGKRYAQIIEMMWFTFLYIDLIPAGTIIILFGLCLYYWVDKYNLLRRSSLNHNISANLSEKVSDLIDFTLFWRCVGQIIFDKHLKNQISIHSIVLLVLSILYILLPIKSLINYFANEDFNLNDKRIGDVWNQNFKADNYKSFNPIFVQIFKDNKTATTQKPEMNSSSQWTR